MCCRDSPCLSAPFSLSKFYRRFRYIEEKVTAAGKPMTEFTLEQLDAWWEEAKKQGL